MFLPMINNNIVEKKKEIAKRSNKTEGLLFIF
jgi:hypothetical protein